MRIIFLGDGEWAARALRLLVDAAYDVCCVVDRVCPTSGALALVANSLALPYIQPAQINDDSNLSVLSKFDAELGVSFSYDQIFSERLLGTTNAGYINCHAGALPNYRGRNVLNWALINGESEIGLTVHKIDKGVDTGDILSQEMMDIEIDDTYGSLIRKITDRFPLMLVETLRNLQAGSIEPMKQSHLKGTYFRKRVTGDEWINWSDSSVNIYNFVRGITHPGPGAATSIGGIIVKIWSAAHGEILPEFCVPAGQIVRILENGSFAVKTGDLPLLVTRFTAESGKNVDLNIGSRFDVDW